MEAEESPGDPIFDDEKEELMLQSIYDEFEVFTHYVTPRNKPNEMIAILRMRYVSEGAPSYPGNEKIMRNLLYVLKDYRNQCIGLELLKLATKYSEEHGKSLMMTGTSQEDGRRALKKLGAKEALTMKESRANLNDIEWKMVEAWEKEGPKRSPDCKLEFFTKIPDEILEDYCKVYTEVANQAPLEELDLGDMVYTPEFWRKQEQKAEDTGIIWLTAIVRDKNGVIAGLTDVYFDPSHTPFIYTGFTGVQENFRGSGKGKWLKGAMFLRIREQYPDIKIVTTSNATTNAPMLAINERLGFKIHKEHYSCQVETEKVVDYVKKKQ
jgi:mycothiol synthase